MKICHLTSAHKSNDVRIFEKECKSLQKNGYNVYLIAPGVDKVDSGIHILGISDKGSSRLLRMLFKTREVYKKALEVNADIYHIHDPELLPYGHRLKKAGKKVIFDSHEDVIGQIREKEYIPSFLRNFIAYAYGVLQNRIIKDFDAVISVTPHICEKLKMINPNCYMITNYPLCKQNHPIIQRKGNNICFAGGISRQWQHHVLLKALENCDLVTYTLCGAVSEDYLNELKKYKAWEKVNYLGKISHAEVSDVLAASSCGIAVLNYNINAGNKLGTLGNTKLFEYMQMGLPVICTDFILWKEIIEKYKCGICVSPNDVSQISNAINYILSNPDIAEEMGSRGYEAVMNEYNWNTQETVLMKLYSHLAN